MCKFSYYFQSPKRQVSMKTNLNFLNVNFESPKRQVSTPELTPTFDDT